MNRRRVALFSPDFHGGKRLAAAILLGLALFLLPSQRCHAQLENLSGAPVEINADSTRFEGGVAIAEGNAVINYEDSTIYADYAQYNTGTHDLLVRGNVRIYEQPVPAPPGKPAGGKPGHVFVGDRAVYNLDTKELRAADFRGLFEPFFFSTDTLSSLGPNAYQLKDALMTTSDSSKPDYYIRAKSVRVYPKDRIIFSNVTLYVGRTPVFWFPYLWQWLKEDSSFTIEPGYSSLWGAFLLSQYTFPLAKGVSGQLQLDVRSLRGVGVGFNSRMRYGPNDKSWARFRSYYVDDLASETNDTSLNRESLGTSRYRLSFQDKTYISEDISALVDINKLSDPLFLQDFEQNESRINPQPDNVAAITKLGEDFSLTAIARIQLNSFFDTTERLPELVLDVKPNGLFGTGIFYEGETGAAYLRQVFGTGTNFPNYETLRLDSFHQLLYPRTYFGWLTVTPRAGIRETYYGQTGDTQSVTVLETEQIPAGLNTPAERVSVAKQENELFKGGPILRTVLNAGIESSFKFSRAFEGVQSRLLGLDGLRHVVQPYTDLSWVQTDHDASSILQFDRFQPSDQEPPIQFPQFTSIDSISSWTIWRLGVRNRLETRRDSSTITWLDIDTYFDLNIRQPNFPGISYREGSLSNVHNLIRLNPVPWAGMQVDSQLPVLKTGFTEVNTSFNFIFNPSWQVNVGHRYIEGNPYFVDSSDLTFGTYVRLNENWALSMSDEYEFVTHTVENQLYQVHRDLSSWISSLGLYVRNNGGSNLDFGITLTFTLKDAPQASLPFSFDPYNSNNR